MYDRYVMRCELNATLNIRIKDRVGVSKVSRKFIEKFEVSGTGLWEFPTLKRLCILCVIPERKVMYQTKNE